MASGSGRLIAYHHVTHNITRPNVSAARHFYAVLLGLREIPATEDPEGLRLIWFEVGSQQLHLSIRDTADRPSSRHVAVVVEDADRLIERLSEAGVVFDDRDGARWVVRRDGSRSAFCFDPDGNRLELIDRGTQGAEEEPV